MTVKGYLERPYANGVLKYELTVQVWESGADAERYEPCNRSGTAGQSLPCGKTKRVSYGILVSKTLGEFTCTERADDITDDADTALTLLLYLFLQSVDACHLRDVLEDLLPVECDLERLIKKREPERRLPAAREAAISLQRKI